MNRSTIALRSERELRLVRLLLVAQLSVTLMGGLSGSSSEEWPRQGARGRFPAGLDLRALLLLFNF